MFSGGTIWNPRRNTSIGGLLSNALLLVLFTGADEIFRFVFLFFLCGECILLNIIRLVFLGEFSLPGSMGTVLCAVAVVIIFLFLLLAEAFFARDTLAGITAAFFVFETNESDT